MGECTVGAEALRSLLDTEYAFGTLARTSIRTAFLEYLAEDSLVLQPAPTAGRAFYGSAQDSLDKLEWYPALADLSGSGDLGFSLRRLRPSHVPRPTLLARMRIVASRLQEQCGCDLRRLGIANPRVA